MEKNIIEDMSYKIAMCISGEMRNFTDPLIRNSLSKIIDDLDCDVFISTWSHEGTSYNKINGNVLDKRTDINQDLTDSINDVFSGRVKSLEIEDYNQWVDVLDTSIIEMMSTKLSGGEAVTSPPQLYKIYKCNQLKIGYENLNFFEYDITIRSRPDLIFMETPEMTNLDKINHINFGIKGAYWPMRIFDIFFYSNNSAMNKLSNSWLSILEDSNKPINNELDPRDACSLLYINAIKNNIEVNDLQRRICGVYRGEGYDQFVRSIEWMNNGR